MPGRLAGVDSDTIEPALGLLHTHDILEGSHRNRKTLAKAPRRQGLSDFVSTTCQAIKPGTLKATSLARLMPA